MFSGLVLLLLLHGDSTLDVTDLAIAETAATAAANAHLLAAVADHPHLDAVTTLLARMNVVTVIETTMTAAAPAALTSATVR